MLAEEEEDEGRVWTIDMDEGLKCGTGGGSLTGRQGRQGYFSISSATGCCWRRRRRRRREREEVANNGSCSSTCV